MVINAGDSTVSIPLIGEIAFGWIYTLFLIPLGIAGASTTFNFLAGFNGLEAGQGILILSALSIVAYSTGITWLALMGLCMVFSLLAFWIYNKFPARVFPGDVITYPVGGMIALMAILGNMEVIAVFFFIPYIIELILKVRGRLKMQSFGKPNRNNGLEMPYNKIYGLEHFAMYCLKKITKNGKVYEKDVVYFIHIIQIIIIGIGFVIFRNSIF
jgi:UDP-N-acetylglucosamine--dolichyl-phosphate N-acetylglucosaminephosphotransferase